MAEYGYSDFINALGETGQAVLCAVAERIRAVAPLFLPCGVRYSKTKNEWELYFRKNGKAGKSVCAAFASGGKLTLRLAFLTSAVHEFLLRQNEFSTEIRRTVLSQTVCTVQAGCRCYGNNNPCEWRQRFYIDGKLIAACPYPWISLDFCGKELLPDILKLIDLQLKHMVQDAKDIKGNGFGEETRLRCGEVFTVKLENTRMNVDDFCISDHVSKPQRLEKYAALYSLVPMGESGGLWYYLSDSALKGENIENLAYAANQLSAGTFAAVNVADPMSFSLVRSWNYICEYLARNAVRPKAVMLASGESAACFAQFYRRENVDCATVYVPTAQ